MVRQMSEVVVADHAVIEEARHLLLTRWLVCAAVHVGMRRAPCLRVAQVLFGGLFKTVPASAISICGVRHSLWKL
jgi:hypothetical protein